MSDEHAEICLRCAGTGLATVADSTAVTTVIGMIRCPRCGGYAIITAGPLVAEVRRLQDELVEARATRTRAQAAATAEVEKRRSVIVQLKTAVEILDARYLVSQGTTEVVHSGAAQVILKIIADMESGK